LVLLSVASCARPTAATPSAATIPNIRAWFVVMQLSCFCLFNVFLVCQQLGDF